MQTSWNNSKDSRIDTILSNLSSQDVQIADLKQIVNSQGTSISSIQSDLITQGNNISSIKTKVSSIQSDIANVGETRDIWSYMLVKPTNTTFSVNIKFKDCETILDIENIDNKNVQIGIFPCGYNTTIMGEVPGQYFIDGILEDNVAQIFSNVYSSNKSYFQAVKNMFDLRFQSLEYNGNNYSIFDNYNDSNNDNQHCHNITSSVDRNFDVSPLELTSYKYPYCTSKYFKRLRLKAQGNGSYLIIFKTKNKFSNMGSNVKYSIINTLDGTNNFQEDKSNSVEFTHYRATDDFNIDVYVKSNSIVIPPTLI